MTPAQLLMKTFALAEKYPQDGYGEHATALIKKHTAKELFEPDEALGKNVLHYAISTNNAVNAIDLINKQGVTSEQLFHQDTHGYTPLHEAIANGKEMVAKALINKAETVGQLQRVTHIYDEQKTALQMAHDNHMPKVVLEIKARIKDLSADLTQTKLPSYITKQQSILRA